MSRKGVTRIEASVADQWFPNRSEIWPSGYLPALGISHFLRPAGVPFRDVLDTRSDLQNDRNNVIQRDFASDYGLWLQSELQALETKAKSNSRVARAMKRITNRESLPSIESQCSFWNLVDPASFDCDSSHAEPPAPPASPNGTMKNPPPRTETLSSSTKPYAFRSFASTQEYAMLPICDVSDPQSIVKFATFPQLRNCLYAEYDSCSALKALSFVTGDKMVYTQEFVLAVASYLRTRLEEIGEDAKMNSAGSALTYRPILLTFGNGRLAWFLNESRMLPAQVIATQPAKPLVRRALTHSFDPSVVSSNITMQFPCDTLDVPDALDKYKPAIVVAEPHIDRDFTSEMRGYHTVRELLMIGQVDSPAMGSFTYPLLSWGVLPGPRTYWVFNDSLQRATQRGHNLPTDPPYVAQGYRRYFIDDISRFQLHPNDTPGLQNQSRCVSFRRERIPSPPTLHHPAH